MREPKFVVEYGFMCPGEVYPFIQFETIFWRKQCNLNLYNSLIESNNLQLAMENSSITLNMLAFVDLYLTLTNPFKPRKSRNKYYYIITVIYSILFGIIWILYAKG